jgi:hypothetical protein
MLGTKQKRAVKLLFEITDAEVAEKLKVSRVTLEEWKQNPEFAEAVQQVMKDNRQSAIRMLSRLYLDACRELDSILRSDDDKNKHRVIMELLKASGLLKEFGIEEGDYVGAVLRRHSEPDEEDEEREID